MKCYLHIGTEKTATTSLQDFFNINRALLIKKGFLYSKSAGVGNNFKLPILAYNKEKRDDLTNICNISNNKTLFDYQKTIISGLKKEIEEDRVSNVVFSSEHIQSRLISLEEINKLKDTLFDLGIDEVNVIVYIRNPVEIANSLFSTAIINGHDICSPPSPKNAYFNNICNHKNTLEKFGHVFGKDALIPRLFDKNSFVNGSIINDFLEITGIPWCDNYQIPDKLNESISPLGLEILKRFNKKVPLFINNKTNLQRGDIIKYFQNYFIGNKYFMPMGLQREYEIEFKDSNEWVRKNWFPKRPYLFHKKDYTNETMIRTSDIELDQFANMLANIWVNKH